ncbi:protein dispatched homolog 1-like [Malaclemys terrapin pileata]|uniref:protein dispatched homolog 1-like n=1 Tax=Malaclemys terrapin pileata TaxID=2991368 RepID=UPI0023A88B89|nr:protein dispatched homolog 1-like [Malaclemys terrapin pileata]
MATYIQCYLLSLRPARPFKLPKSYAALIADWPVVVLGMCTVLIVVCALVGILVPDLPDFSDPLLLDNLKSTIQRKKQNGFARSKMKTWMKSCADEIAISLHENEPEYELDGLPDVVKKD